MQIVPGGGKENLGRLTAWVFGYGKRTPLEEYPVKGRGTRGVINIDATERNGDVIGMKLVSADDEVMLITEKGILIRTRVSEIRETGRGAQGVRLIKLDEGDKLVAMAKIDAEDVGGPEGEAETPAGPEEGSAPEASTDGEPKPETDGEAPRG
jgi:DNA gyrase subunit A